MSIDPEAGEARAKIMCMLVRRELEAEGRSYLRSYLDANGRCGKQLGPLLASRNDLESGTLWAYVPSPLPAPRLAPLTDFETGGLYPGRDPEWNAKLDEWLASLSDAGISHICLEDAYARPSDGWLASDDRPVFFCGESVFLSSRLYNSSLAPPLAFGGATWRPDVSIAIPPIPGVPTDRSTVDPALLGRLVDEAVAVIVGAWDDEGFIVWERAG